MDSYDCCELRKNLTEESPFNPNLPTDDYDTFISNVRDVNKHPEAVAWNVPILPTANEVYPLNLPNPHSVVDVNNRSQKWTLKNRLRKSSNPVPSPELCPYTLMSLKLGEEEVLLLIDRVNLYLKASRDLSGDWWEFSSQGDILFHGTKPLGYDESYTSMGKSSITVGNPQLEQAFMVHAHPADYSAKERKKASKTVIATFCEGGRSTILSSKFSEALNNYSEVKVTSQDDLLINNWGTVSEIIVQNCDEDKEIKDLLPTHHLPLVKVLNDNNMFLLSDSPAAYGLLKAKKAQSGASSTGDLR